MGNMPNAGLFLIRGEYTTGFNGNSNKQLPPPGESSVNNVSGKFLQGQVVANN